MTYPTPTTAPPAGALLRLATHLQSGDTLTGWQATLPARWVERADRPLALWVHRDGDWMRVGLFNAAPVLIQADAMVGVL